jgi:large subunit ribosomal protein L25
MKHPTLVAEQRTILGKKVKKLRREGFLPANVYGRGLTSQSVQVKLSEFLTVFKEVGETGLVNLKVKEKIHPVLVKNLQMNYKSQTPLHVDFYQVNLKEKVKTMIPVVLVGEAQAVAEKIGMLLQTLSEIEIEALPDQLAENIEVSVVALAAIDDHLTVGDLTAPEGVTILTDGSQVIAKITELVSEEPEVSEEAAEASEEAKTGETASSSEQEEKSAE